MKSIISETAPIEGKAVFISFGVDLIRPGTTSIRAFVATGSPDGLALASLCGIQNGPAPRALFAGGTSEQYGGDYGVLITISFDAMPPGNLVLAVALWQSGAKYYKNPTLYDN